MPGHPLSFCAAGLAWLGDGVGGDFGAEAGDGENVCCGSGVVVNGAGEIFRPLFYFLRFSIDPIEMRLGVAVGAGESPISTVKKFWRLSSAQCGRASTAWLWVSW